MPYLDGLVVDLINSDFRNAVDPPTSEHRKRLCLAGLSALNAISKKYMYSLSEQRDQIDCVHRLTLLRLEEIIQ